MLELASCWLFGLSCPAPAPVKPTVAIVQAAYEREASQGSPKHDKNLEIIALDCSTMMGEGDHLCWVTFTSKTDAAKVLFFDVASVSNAAGIWRLNSGLCRR